MPSRPAETGGVATAIAVLLAHVFGVNDATVLASLALVVGFVPTAITFLVATFRKQKRPAT